MVLIDENGDPIDPINCGLAKRTFEIDDDTDLGRMVLRTDWPDEMEIKEVDEDDEIIHARADSEDVRHRVCKSLAIQGLDVTASRGAILRITVSDQVDLDTEPVMEVRDDD